MFTYGLGEETFDEIKEKLHAKQALSHEKDFDHKKVLTRNEDWYITPDPKKWRQNYDRRKLPHDSGYFAPKGVPYKPHGNLKALSAISLIEDTLSISVNKPLRYTRQMSKSQPYYPPKSHEDEDNATNNTIVIYDVLKRSKSLPSAPTAGLDLLSKELGSNTRTLTDVRAGNSLKDSVIREFHRKGVLKVIKAPKVIFRNGHPKVINKPCVYLPPMLPTASSKICLLNTPPKGMINPGGDGEEEVASRIKKMTRPTDGKIDEEHETKALLKRNFYAKVKTIYAILCCLHNLKTKELRRYKPLSFSTIKHLSKRPFHLANADVQQQYHMYTASLIAHHHLNIIQNQYHATVHKLPTQSLSLWEDILYLHEENIFFTGDAHGQSMQKQRILPPWKRKVVIDDQEEWRKDEAAKLSRCIKSIQQFKSEMGHKVACALQEKEQLKDRTRTLYLEHLRIKPGKEKNLMEMRVKTYQKRWAERKKDLEKPDWFARLEEEVKSIFEEEGLEQQGYAALEGLKQFMYMGTESLVLVVEKLCLIVMSLPAHYLCIQQVIAAFQFVCEFLIRTSPKLIEHLRRIRNLPSEVIELHPPDYLFGMNIRSTHF